jgi:hypothetical protein
MVKKSTAYYKKKCDTLWSQLIRSSGRCAVCGSCEYLNAHHLIHRSVCFYRHNLNNGICLCPKHHTFGYGHSSEGFSAHGTPWAFEEWMKSNKPDQYAWWSKNRYETHAGVKIDYKEVLDTLKQAMKENA